MALLLHGSYTKLNRWTHDFDLQASCTHASV